MNSLPLAALFATPAAALATAAGAAAVPVVIHLLNRRRYRVVDWAAMRFLQAALKRTTRRLRLEQWLLLAVRTLLVLLPILAMIAAAGWAEPFWQQMFPNAAGAPAFAGRTFHVIIIDGSLSMTARRDDGSAFERAQSMAAHMVNGAAGGDGFSLILLAAPPRVIVHGPANDRGRVAREIGELRCTHGNADVGQALQYAEDALSRSPAGYDRRLVTIFTDLQRTQWSAPPTPTGTWSEPWQRLHAKADVALVDVGAAPAENLAVTGLTLDEPLLTVGSRAALTATVHNFGTTNRKQARVELRETEPNGSPHVARQELIDLPAGTTATVAFPIEFRVAGDHRFDVQLESDALTADDRRTIGVRVRAAVPTLLVDGRPASDAFASASGWLAAALNPFPDSKTASTPARPRIIDSSRLGDPNLNLDGFDVVWLCDVARPTAHDRERLESYVRRGGTIIIGLGPQCDPETYRRVFGGDAGGLLPARLLARERAPAEKNFSPVADEDAFRRPPLAAFAADDDRGALTAARIQEYWRIEFANGAPARRILTLSPPAPTGDALVCEWSHGRGRVLLFTTTLNTDWTSWPVAPSFPPFVQELLRYAARQPPRRDLIVGEAIDEALGDTVTATEATISPPDAPPATVALTSGEDAMRLRFTDTDRSGLYTARIAGLSDRVFAVNVPSGGESDLSRVAAAELPPTGTGEEPQVVTDPMRARRRIASSNVKDDELQLTGEIGSAVARWPLLIALALLLIEPILAWRFGSARGPSAPLDRPSDTSGRRFRDKAIAALAAIPLTLVIAGALIALHAAITGELFSFLPNVARSWVEQWLGVPAAAPGEGTRWRLDRLPAFTSDPQADRWLVGTAALIVLAVSGVIYWQELRGKSRWAGLPLVALRCGLALLSLFVLLPQLRLVFEREGWPDLVIIIDDSQSMSATDESPNAPTRMQLAQQLLAPQGRDWLNRLSAGKQSRLHIFRAADRLVRIGEIEGQNSAASVAGEVAALQPIGSASRLGDAVRGVLQEFRGSALAGVVVLTDGITTDGDDLSTAARHAARAGVPLWLVGLGDAREPRSLTLGDLRVDDNVHVGDRLIFEARLTGRGGAFGPIPVILSEKQGDKLVELAREEVTPDSLGGPVKVRLAHTPREAGERTFVISLGPQPTEVSTNRLERIVTVDEFKRTRILFIEGRPRYDFRFVKTLFERESDAVRGNKSIELKVLLADADSDYSREDRTALESFPPSRDELFARFDAVILGDVAPDNPLLGEKRLQWLADFVKEKGGGLLLLAGPQYMPQAYRNTPLASVMPVDPASAKPGGVIRPAGYLPQLTAVGRGHPAFRFAPEEQENAEIWSQLKPLYWAAAGLTPKPAAEVLAMLPAQPGYGPAEPLALQQFVGAGRVMLLGFEESWRWRFRDDEPRFNQFWLQLMRHLARTRPSRPELRLDRQTPYRRGEPIRVTVHFPDDQPAPNADVAPRVALDRTPPGGAPTRNSLTLAAVPAARGTYETLVTRTPEGEYTFTLTGVEGRAPTATARVLPPPGEMDRLQLNRADMERAAQISRGRFYTQVNAASLPDDLPAPPRVTLHQPRPPWPLWNTPAIVILGLALVAGEWLLRKRQQLL